MGEGIGMGKTCKLKAVSFQCMTKFTTNLKKIIKKIKIIKIKAETLKKKNTVCAWKYAPWSFDHDCFNSDISVCFLPFHTVHRVLKARNTGVVCCSLQEILRTGVEGGEKGWDGWTISPTQWTWVWANSGRCEGWGDLAWGSPWGRKVAHDLATEQLSSQVLHLLFFLFHLIWISLVPGMTGDFFKLNIGCFYIIRCWILFI